MVYVYAFRADVAAHAWVRRFDPRQCDATSEAYVHCMMLRAHGFPEACWQES